MKDLILEPRIENILKERYYLTQETSWSQVSKRLSETIFPEMFEEILNRTFIPSTPTIMNLNTKGERKGTLSSCFILGIEDSMESIMESMKEAAFVTKAAGGVGYNFSALRGSNEVVKSNGRNSGGPLAFVGIFDAVLEGVRQGCCLTKDSLISTKDGLLKLEEIVKTQEYGWHSHQLEILNRDKTQKSNNYYVNGVSDILQVNTEDGISIRGTPQHKLKVINSNGEEVWKEFQAIEKGDYALVLLGQHEGNLQKLQGVATEHFNQTSITLPKILDEQFAFVLGYLSGDGFMASNERDYRVGFSVAHDSYLFEVLPQKLKKIFGEVSVLKMQSKDNKCCTYVISNKQLKSFLLKNKIFKEKSDKVTVPELIRKSPKSVVGAYLRGLFEADGALSHGYPILSSVSLSLIKEVSALLLGLGCPNKINFLKKNNWLSSREGIYTCRIQSTVGLDNWKKNIGCDPRSRFTRCYSFVSDLAREKVFVLPNVKSTIEKYDAFIQESSLPEKGKIHKQLLRYLRGDRRFSMSSYSYFKTRYPDFENFISIPSDVWYTQVTSVTSLPDEETYDIEVEESHAYIANGFLSHNSRRGAGMSMLSIFHPDILQFLDAKQKEGVFERSNFSVGIKNEFYEVLHTDPHRTFQTRNVVDKKLNDLVDEHGKTYTYQMLWDKIIHNAWNRAEPGIFNEDISADRCSCKHITRNVFCNPCSEYNHISYTSCNLGSINISRFVKGKKMDWKALEKLVEKTVIYLNGIIDQNDYPLEKIRKETLNVRPIGLGMMGLAHALYLKGVPYDSPEGYDFVAKLSRFMTLVGLRKSIELAKEHGKSYPYYDHATFMDANARFFTDDEFMGIDIAQLKKDIAAYGIYNSCITSVAPTGCVEENTRVVTSKGLIKIKDIVANHPEEKQFNYDIPEITAASEKGENRISAFYNNGTVSGYNIELEDGRNIKVSPTHRIRILKDGDYAWEEAPNIKVGDVVVLAKNSAVEVDSEVILTEKVESTHFNLTSDYKQPTILNERLAEWLGIFTGDGSIKFRSENGKADGVRFPADSKDLDFAEYIKEATEELFGIDSRISKVKDKNMYEICAHSINLGNFLIQNGFAKKNKITSMVERNDHIYHVPELIFQSPKKVICAYLRGLFETDGSVSNGQIMFYSKFEHLVKEVQELLTYVGIQSRVSKKDRSQDPNSFNDTMFALNIRYKHDKLIFRDKVGFISKRKKAVLSACEFAQDSERIYLPLKKAQEYRTQLVQKFSCTYPLYQDFNGYIGRTKYGSLVHFNRDVLNRVSKLFPIDLPFELDNIFNLKVKSITREDIKTFDIEVDNDEHTYLTSNGIINHNTISYVADCSSGMEPVFGLVFTRKIEKENKVYEHVYIVDPIFRKHIETNHVADAEKIYKYVSGNKGSCQGCKLLTPEEQAIFKVAGDITPEWHLQILAAVANNISLSCSKTLNVPSDCSEKEISDVFLKAHELGIIGVTVYRDGCRRGILVHEEQKKETEMTKTVAPKRPVELKGEIYALNHKKDKIYVAVGFWQDGSPYEIFVGTNLKQEIEHASGKIKKISRGRYVFLTEGGEEYHLTNGNNDENADALCRILSTALRHGCGLQFLVHQLEKTEGDLTSFSKVISRVLKKFIKDGTEIHGEECPKCKSKLVREEGCAKCSACGFSKCS